MIIMMMNFQKKIIQIQKLYTHHDLDLKSK